MSRVQGPGDAAARRCAPREFSLFRRADTEISAIHVDGRTSKPCSRKWGSNVNAVRASRVLIRIPIKVFSNGFHGEPLDTPAEAIAVSRTGALLRTPFQPALGSRIEVLNGLSQETQEFRVIRVSDSKDDGCYELGKQYPDLCASIYLVCGLGDAA